MNKGLDKAIVYDWKSAQSMASNLEEAITDRIDYILNTIFKTFDNKLSYWYFDGADEGELGDLSKRMNDGEIDGICTEASKSSNGAMIIIDKFGVKWEFSGTIPTRWLYDNEFENELINGKIQYEEKEKIRKAKKKELAAAKKAEDAFLIEKAKKKLTKKELAAIRRQA